MKYCKIATVELFHQLPSRVFNAARYESHFWIGFMPGNSLHPENTAWYTPLDSVNERRGYTKILHYTG